MRTKIHSYLGLARRSGNLLTGYNTCEDAIRRGKLKFLLLAEDLAQNTKNKFEKLAADRNVPVRRWGTRESLSEMTGLEDRGVFGITEGNLAGAIRREIDGNGRQA